MSQFETNFCAAFDDVLIEESGVEITHKSKATGVESDPFLAVAHPVKDTATGKLIRSKRSISISPSNVAQPVAGDTGTIEGRTYRIVEVERSEGGVWECVVDVGGSA
jgi:hypothetical protein